MTADVNSPRGIAIFGGTGFIGKWARQSIETTFSKKKYIKTIAKELFNLIKNT